MQTKTAKILGICLTFIFIVDISIQRSVADTLSNFAIKTSVAVHALESQNNIALNKGIEIREDTNSGIVIKRRNSTNSLESEERCLATAMYYEARGESRKGKWAIADLTLSRVGNPGFPDTICGVVKQRGQYTRAARRGKTPKPRNSKDQEAWRECIEIAKKAIKNPNQVLPENALYFHADHIRPFSPSKYKRVAWIDDHMFYAKRKKK